MTDQPDRLFERFRRSGDSEALGRVFDATAPRLLQLAIHLVGDIGAAEDLVQATFVTAIERATTFDVSRSLDSWLAGILANHARDLKKAARREIDVASLAERVESTPLEHALQTEWSSALAQALDGVPEPYRVILILRLQHGMTPTEIAHALQRSPGAVRVQLHRGREMLRRLLPAGIVASAMFIAEPGRGLAQVKTNVVAHAAVVKGGVGIAGVVGVFLMSTKVMVSIAGMVVALAALLLLRQRAHEPIETSASVESSAASLESSARPHDETLIAESSASPQRIEAAPPVTASSVKQVKLHGLVHDAETNEGVTNAKVELFAPQPMRLSEVRQRWHDRLQVMDDGVVHGIGWPRFASELSDEGRLDAEDVVVYAPPVAGTTPIERAVTNAKGEFEITAPESLGCIVSSAAGYTASIRALSPAEFNKANADELTVKIAMNTPKPLAGYVVDENMKRIERVIRFRFTGQVKRTTYVTVGDRKILAGENDEDPQQDQWVVETKPDGSFECELPATIVHAAELEPDLVVVKQGHLREDGSVFVHDVWPEPGRVSEPLVIVVQQVASIVVRDRASREPIEDIHLLCTNNRYGQPLRIGRFLAPQGRLRLAHPVVVLGPKWIRLEDVSPCECTVWADGYVPLSHPLADLIHGPPVEFELERGDSATLSGRIHDAGRAVSSARIALTPIVSGWGMKGGAPVAMTNTDSDGAFRIAAPNGRYRMRITAGSIEECSTIEIPRLEPIDVDLSTDTAIVADVRDSSGVPPDSFAIALRGLDGRREKSATDSNGVVRFSRLSPGGYVVEVNHFAQKMQTDKSPPSIPDQAIAVELRAGEVKRVEIVIPSSPRFARLVVDGADSLAGWKACGSAGKWVDVEESGRIPLDIRGTPAMRITGPNSREWNALLPKNAPDGHVIRIALDGLGYEGWLTCQYTGEPIKGLRIIARPWNDDSGSALVTVAVSDDKGHFQLTGLADDIYLIRFENVPRTGEREGFVIRTTAKAGSPPTLLSIVLPKKNSIGVDPYRGLGFEGFPDVTLTGVLRAARGSLPTVRGTIVSHVSRPGYTLFLYTDFHASPAGSYQLKIPMAPTFTASLCNAESGELITEAEWTASGATDHQVHDIELP